MVTAAKMGTVKGDPRCAQDEVGLNQKESEQNEVDGMKKRADSTGKVIHT